MQFVAKFSNLYNSSAVNLPQAEKYEKSSTAAETKKNSPKNIFFDPKTISEKKCILCEKNFDNFTTSAAKA